MPKTFIVVCWRAADMASCKSFLFSIFIFLKYKLIITDANLSAATAFKFNHISCGNLRGFASIICLLGAARFVLHVEAIEYFSEGNVWFR